ncbi:MAG: flagellar filament capping protein FliD [Oscillospiraceae bacterium]|jgi:flagellar hook-associated protein 2|nr:flagellar filament capping protein FliD [Oscillospiraceae bacterium]
MAVTPLRFTGMASGLDTDAVIKSMMQVQQLKLDRQIRAKTSLEWKQTANNDVSAQLKTFRETFMSTLSEKNIFSSATFNVFDVKMGETNAAAVTVIGSSEAQSGNFTIDKITQLAKGASVSSKRDTAVQSTVTDTYKDAEGNAVSDTYKVWGSSDGTVLYEDKNGEIFSRSKKSGTPADGTSQYEYKKAYTKVTPEGNDWYALADNGTTVDLTKGVFTKNGDGNFNVKNSWNYNNSATGYKLDSALNRLSTPEGKTLSWVEDALDGTGAGAWLDSDSKVMYRQASDGSLGKLSYTESNGKRTSTLTELIPQTAGPLTKATHLESKEQGVSTGNGLAGKDGSALSTKMQDLQFAKSLQFDKSGNFSFSINNKSFTFSKNDTLATVINTVNADITANVKMSYSSATDGFSIESKLSGTSSTLKIANISGNFFGVNGASGLDINKSEAGQNAIFTLNGKEVTRDSNNFTIDGIRYGLNAVTVDPSDPSKDTAIKFTLNRNVQPAVDKIRDFVDGYNELVSKLTTLITETKTQDERKYTPLTDEEKTGMTEEQIKMWEDTAKKGILHNDSGIQNLLGSLRSALFDKVSAVGLSPADIGLSTYALDYTKGGQIELNETKLREALENRPNDVAKIFTDTPTSESGTAKYQETGLLTRMMDSFSSYNVGPNTTLKGSIQMQLTTMTTKLIDMQNKFADMEEKYYKKFAALESAISKIQAQGESFASMTGMSAS